MEKPLLKLLIVDDKPTEREGIRHVIDWESIGIQIVGEAENGLQGIEMAKQLRPDILITDIVMPQLDGFSMVQEIRKFLPNIKVIFISCYDNFEFAKLAININAMGYVLKPIIASELFATVSKITGIHLQEIKKKKEEVELAKRIKESLPVLREQFLKDILYGICKDEKEIWSKNDFLETRLQKDGTFVVIVIEIDNWESKFQNYSEEQRQIERFRIQEFIEKLCSKYQKDINFNLVGIDRSRFALIINSSDEYLKKSFNIDNFADDLKEKLSKYFQIELTLGISGYTTSILALKESYQEACEALKLKYYLGNNQTIRYTDIYHNINILKDFDPHRIQNDIQYLIMTGEWSEIHAFVENTITDELFKLGTQYVQYVCMSILSCLQITLAKMNETLSSIFGNEFIIFEKLFKIETIPDIKQWLKNIIMHVSSSLHLKNQPTNRRAVALMKEYISKHYHEEINVQSIASHVCLSPCYANYIFKKETGRTLIEYVTKVRIEKAKELLKNSLLKVYEVAEKVGYKNHSYFSLVFKEHCGMTPLEYRNRG